MKKVQNLMYFLPLMMAACTFRDTSQPNFFPAESVPRNFAPVVGALEESARVSDIRFLTRYFVPTGVVVEPSKVEARIMASPNLCQTLMNKKSLYNKNGDSSQMYWASAHLQDGKCISQLTPQRTNDEILRVSFLSSSDELESIASAIIEDENLNIHSVFVYVNGDGDLVEARFYKSYPLNILHGNPGPNGERLSLSFVYIFSLGLGSRMN